MALVLETGAVVAGANSYATEAMADTYFDNRANNDWLDSEEDKEGALIRATAAIDAKYRHRFPGYRVSAREQTLEWPRLSAYDYEGNLIVADEVPQEIIDATIEAAARELTTPGSMMQDLGRGGAIRRLKADTVEIEYADNAQVQTTFQLIDGILSGILESGNGGGLFGVAVRG